MAASTEEPSELAKKWGITDKQLEIMRADFEAIDTDKSGKLSTAELKKALEFMGETVSDEEVQKLCNACDLDGDGQVNWEEFLRLMVVSTATSGSS